MYSFMLVEFTLLQKQSSLLVKTTQTDCLKNSK